MIIIMPVEEKDGNDSRICPHFGRAPYWAIYDSVQKKIEITGKKSEEGHRSGNKVQEILQFEPDMLFVTGMGVKAKMVLDEKGVKIKTGNFRTVQEVIDNIDSLNDFGGACEGEH